MDLKDYRDKWETWSKGKKIISIIIGCCVLTLVLLAISGLIFPDANDTYDDGYDTYGEDAPFRINIDDIPVESSEIDLTEQESQSSSYAYFYEDDGSYAEPAYTTYTEEDIKIILDLSNLVISDDSEIDYSFPFDSGNNVYNETKLTKDISKLLKSDSVSITLDCYDNEGNYITSYDDFEVSIKDGILTLKYYDSNTSDFHTERSSVIDIEDIDYGTVEITGTIQDKEYDRDIVFTLHSDKIVDINVNS